MKHQWTQFLVFISISHFIFLNLLSLGIHRDDFRGRMFGSIAARSGSQGSMRLSW